DVSAGDTINFELHPNSPTAAPNPAPYPLVLYNMFVIIPDSLDLIADTGCNQKEFLACVKVPFGETPTLRFKPKPGRYKYYDASARTWRMWGAGALSHLQNLRNGPARTHLKFHYYER